MTGKTNTGGAGLNLRIVGSNTQPPKPAENMIWFNTDTRIPHWYFQNTAPSDPELGDVYITISTTSTNVLQVLRNNGLKVYFGTARQWNGSAWNIVGGKIYYNGSWHNLQTFVYDGTIGNAENNFNHSIGGYPWGYDAPSFTAYSDRFHVGTSGSASIKACWTPNKIDFTGVNKVKIVFTSSGSGGPSTHYFAVFDQKSSSSANYPQRKSVDYTSASASKQTAEIDTSTLTGSYYLGVALIRNSATGSRNVAVYSIELIS